MKIYKDAGKKNSLDSYFILHKHIFRILKSFIFERNSNERRNKSTYKKGIHIYVKLVKQLFRVEYELKAYITLEKH